MELPLVPDGWSYHIKARGFDLTLGMSLAMCPGTYPQVAIATFEYKPF